MNSSKAAISVVQAPESCSSMLLTTVVGQHAAHRADDAVAVGLRRSLRVDLQRRQARHGGNGGDPVADG